MCILAVKPYGVLSPDEATLRRMFTANPDGAGIAYNFKGKIRIIKGIMTVEEFITEVGKIPVDSTALIHARIQTSGGVCRELTHPYPLTNDYEKLTATNLTLKEGFAVAHNGIFSGFSNKTGYNDTIQFIGNHLTPLNKLCIDAGKSILDKSMKPIINRLVDTSRLAIMDTVGNFETYGNGWIEDNGIWYSNSTYKPYTYSYSTKNFRYSDYYDDYDSRFYDNEGNLISYYSPYNKKNWCSNNVKNTITEKDNEELQALIKDYPEFEDCIKEWFYKYGYPVETLKQWAEKGWLYKEEV